MPLLFGLLLLASMFDLFPGTWKDEAYTLTIGPPETREFSLNQARGTYKVTATKGDYHVTWSVREGQLQLESYLIQPGAEVRLIVAYSDSGLRLTVFDPEIAPVLTRDFPRNQSNSPR